MSNKRKIELVQNKSNNFKVAYLNNDLKAINNHCLSLLNDLKECIPKKYKVLSKKLDSLTFNLGNNKIGIDTLCINVNCALLCPMALLNKCNNCKICYAMSHNKQYFDNTVFKNVINQIVLNKVLLKEITLHEILFNTVYNIFFEYSENKINNIKFIRFNVESDILNNDMLYLLDKIAYHLNLIFDSVSYTYTHNKDLNLSNVKNIVFNCSDFKKDNLKTVNTIYKLDSDLMNKIYNKDIILCNGKCHYCSYCKNKNDKRDIYFLAHGGQYKGLDTVNDYLLSFINENKEYDYKKFILGDIYE